MNRYTACSSCGKLVERRIAHKFLGEWYEVEVDGKILFFCSRKCMAQKLGEPQDEQQGTTGDKQA